MTNLLLLSRTRSPFSWQSDISDLPTNVSGDVLQQLVLKVKEMAPHVERARELMLMKAAILLDVKMRMRSPATAESRGSIFPMLASVCRGWRQLMRGGNIRRRIRRYFHEGRFLVELLTRHGEVLERSLEVTTELLASLVSANVIRHRDSQIVSSNVATSDRAAALLDALKSGGGLSRIQWIRLLRTLDKPKIGHHHVVNLLQPTRTRHEDDRPLTDAEVEYFDNCREDLTDHLTTSDDLLDQLVSLRVILPSHRQRLLASNLSDNDSAAKLLDIIRTRGYLAFQKFAKALEDSGQWHVVSILERNGVIVRLKCDDMEPELEDRLQDELVRRVEAIRRLEFITPDDVDEQTTALNRVMKSVISVRRGCLMVGVFCADLFSTAAVLHSVDSGTLKTDLQSWFSRSTASSPSSTVNLLTIKVLHRPVIRLPPILPYEMKELIIWKAAALYDRRRWLRTRLVEPVSHVYETLAGVCSLWSEVLRSQRVRRILRRYFDGLCSPYPRTIEHEYTLLTNEGVTGVARLDDRLYVTVYVSDIIRVYEVSGGPPYQPVEPIKAKDLRSPWDMTACCYLSRVYVTDFDTGGIWFFQTRDLRMEASERQRRRSSSVIERRPSTAAGVRLRLVNTDSDLGRWDLTEQGWLIREVEGPRGISVTSHGQVIVVSWEKLTDSSCILVIDPFNGELTRRIPLPDDVAFPHHAVEFPDSSDTFVVCHGVHTSLHRVCLVSTAGQVIRSFGGVRHRSTRTPSDSSQPVSAVPDDNADDVDFGVHNPLVLMDEDIEDEPCSKRESLTSQKDREMEREMEFHRTLDNPYAVAVDRDGHVLVIDYGGRRVLILDRQLTLKRTLLTSKHIDEPRQLWLDRKSGHLYVGQDTGAVDAFVIRPEMTAADRKSRRRPAADWSKEVDGTVRFYRESVSELAAHLHSQSA